MPVSQIKSVWPVLAHHMTKVKNLFLRMVLGWKGHVGFYLRTEGDCVFLFGGNQLGEVREHYYNASTVLGYRWPAGIQHSDENNEPIAV